MLNRIEHPKLAVDADAYEGSPVTLDGLAEAPLGSVITDPDTGQVLAAYLPWFPHRYDSILSELDRVKFTIGRRTQGLAVRSVNFGYLPRVALRQDYCRAATLNRSRPKAARLLAAEAPALEAQYADLIPDVFAEHSAKAGSVLPEWRLPGCSAFTGGIVNKDASIGYHHDGGNFPDTFSAMICLRRHTDGGELAVPELGHYFPVEDRSVLYFNGQGLLHGVTPISKRSTAGFRYTAVYFSLQQLWACLPPGDEARKAQLVRTKRERDRAAGVVPKAVADRIAQGAPP